MALAQNLHEPMSEAAVLWTIGTVAGIVLGLISYIFYQHTKSDDAMKEDFEKGLATMQKDITDLKVVINTHVAACTERVRQDAKLIVEVSHLAEAIKQSHEDTRAYVTRELHHMRELTETMHEQNCQTIETISGNMGRLQQSVQVQARTIAVLVAKKGIKGV